MLERLFVRNFALVESLELELCGGLVLLTGETGAGKSLLVGALSSLLGGKVDASLILSKGGEAVVEAVFSGPSAEVTDFLEGLGIACGGEVVLRRRFDGRGRNTSHVNGSAVNLGQLKAVASSLIEINGQHQGTRLLDEDNHLRFLDSGTETSELSRRVAASAHELGRLSGRLKLAEGKADELRRKVEALREEIGEIDKVSPRENEDAELRDRKRLLENGARIMEDLSAIASAVTAGEPSLLSLMKDVLKRAEDLSGFDREWSALARELESARQAIAEAGRSAEAGMSGLEFSPGELDAVQERLYVLERLSKKHGGTLDDVIRRRGEASEELRELGGSDLDKEELRKRVGAAFEEWTGMARELSLARRSEAKGLCSRVLEALRPLALEKARFEVAFRPLSVMSPDDATEKGLEEAGFLFSANEGEPPLPLSRIASGGELSRTMLAILCSVGERNWPRTLVFDEVDAGIGGKPAEKVGAYLHRLSANGQVICVTHLPQIAAYADQHVKVEKASVSGRTSVMAGILPDGERKLEIARMLAGEKITESATNHAAELLRMAGENKRRNA